MGTFSTLLAICAGNLPVPSEFPAQRPVTRSFAVFFDLCLNKRSSKQSWGWWFETLSRPLWRHRNVLCLFPDDKEYVIYLQNALESNMMSGDAKLWLSCMFARLTKDHPELRKMRFTTPTTNSCFVNAVEMMYGKDGLIDLYWNAPPNIYNELDDGNSCAASTTSTQNGAVQDHSTRLSRSGPSFVAPDFLAYLDSYPGVFPLVIEIKGPKEEGINQNLKQMLSKLHFQDIVFGIMITPVKYVLTAIIKRKDGLHFVKTNVYRDLQLTKRVGSVHEPYHLNVDALHTLHKYICSVLLWASKTRCKFNDELT